MNNARFYTFFKKKNSTSHRQVVGAGREIRRKYSTWKLKPLCATVRSAVARATWRLGLAHY
jgi:hypothetical protein